MSLQDLGLLAAIVLGTVVLPVIDLVKARRERRRNRAEITEEIRQGLERFGGGPPAAGGSAA